MGLKVEVQEQPVVDEEEVKSAPPVLSSKSKDNWFDEQIEIKQQAAKKVEIVQQEEPEMKIKSSKSTTKKISKGMYFYLYLVCVRCEKDW